MPILNSAALHKLALILGGIPDIKGAEQSLPEERILMLALVGLHKPQRGRFRALGGKMAKDDGASLDSGLCAHLRDVTA